MTEPKKNFDNKAHTEKECLAKMMEKYNRQTSTLWKLDEDLEKVKKDKDE